MLAHARKAPSEPASTSPWPPQRLGEPAAKTDAAAAPAPAAPVAPEALAAAISSTRPFLTTGAGPALALAASPTAAAAPAAVAAATATAAAWLPALLANSLYALAACLYWYNVFLGFTALPFLHRTNLFLAPAGAALLVCAVCSALNVNIAALTLASF